ncbi:unnamed protein product [Effrenium voratum]|uniref:Uncharacterized protein n=1 Tax=Effrenium voratum TaxID=2562239 RepID=A0AA36ILF9_9DINO|nr:unnamed protein product [Effrenium voratum]CAJ1412498.1 unnamed protein product [Effrenium voratum]
MEQAVPAECEFQNLLQATLEGSPDLSQQALRALQTLLRFKPEAIKLGNAKASPLTTAVRAGNVECTKVLLKARASPNEQDDKGVSPLHLATFDGNPDLCKALLFYRADVDACDRHGQAPLFFAPSKDVCKLLLERRSLM